MIARGPQGQPSTGARDRLAASPIRRRRARIRGLPRRSLPDDLNGSAAGGGCDARPENSSAIFPPWRPSLWGELGKSESPARSDRYVVVGPSTTKECRGWPNHDKRAPGTHVPAGASGPGVTPAPALGREVSDDHGSAGGGAWQSNPGPADPGNRLVIEWNAGLS